MDEPSLKKIYASLGYYDYQAGLITRYVGQGDGWKQHLSNCRNFILKAVEIIKPEKITVLGSGWLLDLPLAELSQTCREVVLTDIAHPPDVRRQIRSMGNVSTVNDDISGGLAENVWIFGRKSTVFRRIRTLKGLEIPEYSFSTDPGLVISLNILSQIDFIPIRYLKKRCRIEKEELSLFRKAVQASHLKLLLKYPSVLITDFEEVFTKTDGSEYIEKTVEESLPSGKYREEWTWDFDLKRADYYTLQSRRKVAAVIL
jgi:hypothetical protein